MTVAEAMQKMILLSDANFHDINHFLKVHAYALTIGGREYDLTRNFAFFSRSYSLDELGWEIEGDFMSLDYEITQNGRRVAAISRAFLTLGDRYALEVFDPQDALIALCTVLAIDCCDEEHSR